MIQLGILSNHLIQEFVYDSVDDKTTTFCFLETHQIGFCLNNTQYPLVEIKLTLLQKVQVKQAFDKLCSQMIQRVKDGLESNFLTMEEVLRFQGRICVL